MLGLNVDLDFIIKLNKTKNNISKTLSSDFATSKLYTQNEKWLLIQKFN